MDSTTMQPSRRRFIGQLGMGLAASVAAQRARGAMPMADEPRLEADPWTRARTQLVLNPRLAYFDTTGFGLNARAVLANQFRAQEVLHSDPIAFYEARYSSSAVQEACQRMARWLDVGSDELCFTRGALAGLIQCANALNLQSGDEVLISAQVPEALRRFWIQQARQRALILKTIDLPVPVNHPNEVLMAFSNALSERSKVLVCSHVQPGDGAILPIRELCELARARGLISLIDGTLALGALQFSVRELGCDVYGTSLCHWLNGPQQTGVLVVRAELQNSLATDLVPNLENLPISTSLWPKLLRRWPDDFVELAPQFQSVSAALSWQESIGRGLIEARLRELHAYARLRVQAVNGMELLTPQHPGMWLAVLSLRPAQRNAAEVARWLRNNDKVMVGSYEPTPGGLNALRISLHIYNSHDEIERLLQGLQRALRT